MANNSLIFFWLLWPWNAYLCLRWKVEDSLKRRATAKQSQRHSLDGNLAVSLIVPSIICDGLIWLHSLKTRRIAWRGKRCFLFSKLTYMRWLGGTVILNKIPALLLILKLNHTAFITLSCISFYIYYVTTVSNEQFQRKPNKILQQKTCCICHQYELGFFVVLFLNHFPSF